MKCEVCPERAVRQLDGYRLCKDHFRMALNIKLEAELSQSPSPKIHVGNPHPSTPYSEMVYEGW